MRMRSNKLGKSEEALPDGFVTITNEAAPRATSLIIL